MKPRILHGHDPPASPLCRTKPLSLELPVGRRLSRQPSAAGTTDEPSVEEP
jgi:hypothetical protein